MKFAAHTRRLIAAVLAAGLLALGAPLGAFAATPDAAPPPGSNGPQFYSGTFIDVSGAVHGDVYAAGQTVTISGDVTGDVIAAAQTITVTGTVDGNVRLAGQDVTISGKVSRSGTIFAANVTVASTGSLGDDLVSASSAMTIAGKIGRDLFVSVGRLGITGSIGGNVTYTSDQSAQISDGAVKGTVQHIEPPQSPRIQISPWLVILGWILALLYALIALSLVTALAGWLFPRVLERVTDHLLPSPWRALLVGFLASIAVPAVLLFLVITIVGAPLALAGLVVWIGAVLATFVYGAYYLGRLVIRGAHHPVVKALVGGLILIVGLQIPWLNILVLLAMVFFGLGAQLLELYRRRPWERTEKMVAVTHDDSMRTP
ncbi:polymer-forming cytoskeletal protein [Microbacterium rhizomatis]|uniref:DUF8173 domain-containing protein n=1 Tax=Microbacterium rhizomatis TaxID=1631477 RepID=A0A5J5J8R4_9MICO|nr:polymer-forming cytoskeletal protein [Microbacterium rhizomatis]KAA9111405.1 hypothetical protein F6B43_07480 [Microbacterium rhizomatis]